VGATLLWAAALLSGAASVGWGLFMTLKGTTTLQFFADLSGLLAGGLLGMFLLGMMSRRVTNGIAVEVLVIAWMTLSRLQFNGQDVWPTGWVLWRSPLHHTASAADGTVIILAVGLTLAAMRPGSPASRKTSASAARSDAKVGAA
jgi:SSS family solute:Na+ symporter